MARTKRPATYNLDPTLAEVRDAQAEREGAIARAVRPKATLDPKLAAERDAQIKREAELKGRSVMSPPVTG
jgi:hypothetical protein